MPIIDFEAHYCTGALLESMENRTAYPVYTRDPWEIKYTGDNTFKLNTILVCDSDRDIDERLREMDESGVDMQVISLCGGLEELPVEEQAGLATRINDRAARICGKHPDRFKAWATLPVLDTDAAITELERCVKEHGFFGWNTFANYGENGYPDEQRFIPIFEKCSKLGVPVYMHPAEPHDIRYLGYGKLLCANALGGGQQTVLALMRMIVSGLFKIQPDLQIMLGHLGEGLPFILERIDAVGDKDPEQMDYIPKTPGMYFRENIIMTTSGQYSAGAFMCTKMVCGLDRVVFGSDYPMERSLKRTVNFINSLDSFTEEEKAGIFSGNARRLFGC